MIEIEMLIDEKLTESLRKQIEGLYDDYCMKDKEVINCDIVGSRGLIKVLIECRCREKTTLYVRYVEE